MAHDSLRKSVFELVNDLGLDVVAFGGEFHSIEEEDETDQPERSLSSKRGTTGTTSSVEAPNHYPFTPPQSASHESPSASQLHIHFEERPGIFPDFPDSPALPIDATRFGTVIADGTKAFSPSPRPGKLRKGPHPDQLAPEPPETEKDRLKQEKKAKKEREKVEKGREKQEKLAAKEKEKGKKAKDAQERGRTSSSAEDEDKKNRFMRFRLKSRERKTAENSPAPVPEETVPSLPTIPQAPAILPIADKFARDADATSLSDLPRDSQSSNGVDPDFHPRPRGRVSRYERPHPAWRTSYTTGHPIRIFDKEEPESVLPAEIHALPPGQTPEDRSRRPSVQPIVDEAPQEVQPSVDPEIIRQYYGLPSTPAPIETEAPERRPSPTFAKLTPTAQKTLQQALKLATTDLSPKGSPPRSSPTKATQSEFSPYIIPSPEPTQHTFNLPPPSKQPIASVAKRGGIHFAVPPPVNIGLPLPRRANDPNNPPPTPPPTTGLPPTPPEGDAGLLSPHQPTRVPSPRSPGPYGRAGAMLGSRATSPTLRPSSPSMRVPSPGSRPSSPLRPPGTATGTGGSKRGRSSPFPTKPVVKPSGTGNYLLNRRVDVSVPGSPLRTAKATFTDTRTFEERHSEEYEDLVVRVHAGLEDPQHATLAPPSRRDVRRSRDAHRGSAHAGGYESDGADTESLDTYYGRNTLYSRDGDGQFSFHGVKEREEAMRHMPMSAGGLRGAALDDIEHEREQGRERLVRLLVGQRNRI